MLAHLLDVSDLQVGALESENESHSSREIDGPLPIAISFERVAPKTRQGLESFYVVRFLDDVDSLNVLAGDDITEFASGVAGVFEAPFELLSFERHFQGDLLGREDNTSLGFGFTPGVNPILLQRVAQGQISITPRVKSFFRNDPRDKGRLFD